MDEWVGGLGSEILEGVCWVVGMCSSGQCTVENGNIFDIGVKKQHDLPFDEIWRTTLLYELCFGLFVLIVRFN